MATVVQAPAVIEPVIVSCCPIAGGSVYLEHGTFYFTGWELVAGPCALMEHRVVIRTATPYDVAKAITRDFQKLLNGGAH